MKISCKFLVELNSNILDDFHRIQRTEVFFRKKKKIQKIWPQKSETRIQSNCHTERGQ